MRGTKIVIYGLLAVAWLAGAYWFLAGDGGEDGPADVDVAAEADAGFPPAPRGDAIPGLEGAWSLVGSAGEAPADEVEAEGDCTLRLTSSAVTFGELGFTFAGKIQQVCAGETPGGGEIAQTEGTYERSGETILLQPADGAGAAFESATARLQDGELRITEVVIDGEARSVDWRYRPGS